MFDAILIINKKYEVFLHFLIFFHKMILKCHRAFLLSCDLRTTYMRTSAKISMSMG